MAKETGVTISFRVDAEKIFDDQGFTGRFDFRSARRELWRQFDEWRQRENPDDIVRVQLITEDDWYECFPHFCGLQIVDN